VKSVLLFSSKYLGYLVPPTILVGLAAGYYADTSPLGRFILPMVILMIYPSMIGLQYEELARVREVKLIVLAFMINFVLIPLMAYGLGIMALASVPGMFAGLAVVSLLPTSAMTVTYTVLAEGNVEASVKITMASLVFGTFLAPWYLYAMIGQFISFDIIVMIKTLAGIILLPLMMGWVTFRMIMKRYTKEAFATRIKPFLPGISAWGAIFIIFTSISMKARSIFESPEMISLSLGLLVLFYLFNYALAIGAVRFFGLSREDGYTLVYCSALRNIAIAIGISATVFDSHAVFMISLAFLIQPVAASWFYRISRRFRLLCVRNRDVSGNNRILK